MRNYDYGEKWQGLLTPEIVNYMTLIHEYKGEQRLIASRHADILTNLMETARIQSTESSNKIEGIYTSDERLRKIVWNKTVPRSRNEREIAGYRDVLATIHDNYAHIPVRSTFILQLHRDLYKFQPVAAGEAAESVDRLCEAFGNTISHTDADPLLLIPMFILDFLCIRPFRDGNGRMSRLLTLLLLYQSEYTVGKYISIEKWIEKTKDSYDEALRESSLLWHEGENDYKPFVIYMLGVLAAAYREFSDQTRLLEEKKLAKPDRVEEAIRNNPGTITKSELLKRVTDISQTTVQRTLTELTRQGKIRKIGNGRYTKYAWNRERESPYGNSITDVACDMRGNNDDNRRIEKQD